MHRRQFLRTSSAVLAFSALQMGAARAVPEGLGTEKPITFDVGRRVPTLDELLEGEMTTRGIGSPYAREVKKARTILSKCPVRRNPMRIAQYFQELRQGELNSQFGSDAHLYAEEWPVRANPVIVSFFDATTLRTPNGDQTAWCAAFVNWCIVQGRKNRKDAEKLLAPTDSAASETFRNWGTKTTNPRPGDLVVFEHKTEYWRGHIGFFVSMIGDSIYVLGGNQMPAKAGLFDGTYDRRNTGEINVSRLLVNGADLKLHSFRTDRSLHDLS